MSKLLEDYYDFEEIYEDNGEDVPTPLREEFMFSEENSKETNIDFFKIASEQKDSTLIKKMVNRTKSKPQKKKLIVQFEQEKETQELVSKKEILEKVSFSLNATQHLQMEFEATSFTGVYKISHNPEFLKELQKQRETLMHLKKFDVKTKLLEILREYPEDLYTPLKDLSCLRRMDHAQCSVSNFIIMHGGLNAEKVYIEIIKTVLRDC
jgi:hypothetical protein